MGQQVLFLTIAAAKMAERCSPEGSFGRGAGEWFLRKKCVERTPTPTLSSAMQPEAFTTLLSLFS